MDFIPFVAGIHLFHEISPLNEGGCNLNIEHKPHHIRRAVLGQFD